MILYPDLGCTDQTTKAECYSIGTPTGNVPGYEGSPHGCVWDESLYGGEDPPCFELEPDADDSMSPVSFLLALIAMTCIAPFVVCAEYVVHQILAAPDPSDAYLENPEVQ